MGATSWTRRARGLATWPSARIMGGIVKNVKMKNTWAVKRQYMHYQTKYNRFEKRCSSTSAHCSPALRVKEGDQVTIGQCRPLSKTVRFNVLKIDRVLSDGGKQFSG